jgi:hypothetical protein
MDDEMMLPGALKYGGLTVLAALAAPAELYVHDLRDADPRGWLNAAYAAAGGAGRLQGQTSKSSFSDVLRWLMKH